MNTSKKKGSGRAIPDNINEEYYQISEEIMGSFPRYRPPVDLFFFREDIAVLSPFSHKGARLTNEQVEEVGRLCADGNLFVSRSDHHIYSQHIVKQLDLVLQDVNLKEAEIVNICIEALLMRYGEFYQQPVKSVFEPLYRDILVVTEYLSLDRARINAFMRRLFCKSSPPKHAFNTMMTGLWLWMKNTSEIRRKDMDSMAVALLTHDVGMSKMPPFLINKQGALKSEEREKLYLHPMQGVKIMQKMDIVSEDIVSAAYEHHERMDGSGYPQHLKGAQLKQTARIAAIADSFAAMVTERPYAQAKQPMDAAKELSADPRYDNGIARSLVAAYATSLFGKPQPHDAAEAAG